MQLPALTEAPGPTQGRAQKPNKAHELAGQHNLAPLQATVQLEQTLSGGPLCLLDVCESAPTSREVNKKRHELASTYQEDKTAETDILI